jgi:hypothetical protein
MALTSLNRAGYRSRPDRVYQSWSPTTGGSFTPLPCLQHLNGPMHRKMFRNDVGPTGSKPEAGHVNRSIWPICQVASPSNTKSSPMTRSSQSQICLRDRSPCPPLLVKFHMAMPRSSSSTRLPYRYSRQRHHTSFAQGPRQQTAES